VGMSLEENKQLYIREFYTADRAVFCGMERYTDVCGWTDYYLNSGALFSRRRVFYDMENFPDKLHSHGFFEIVVFLGGTVSYVSGDQVFTPRYGDVMIFPPDCAHTVRTSRDGVYDRVVLYVEPGWFAPFGGIPELFRRKESGCYMIGQDRSGEFLDLLSRMEGVLGQEQDDSALRASGFLTLAISNIARFAEPNYGSIIGIPQKLVDIRSFIDENYRDIATVDELPAQFYYSREHICRLFKTYYQITPSEYLRRKKIDRAMQVLELNGSVGYACDVAGFQSYSAFVRAFRETVGIPPGKYRASVQKE